MAASSKRILRDNIRSLGNFLYYRFIFGQDSTLSRFIYKMIMPNPQRRVIGDHPASKDAWDSDYSRGKWNFIGSIEELSHYSVLIGYASYIKHDAKILDVGCGSGVLFKRFRPYGYSRYFGIDISEVAIKSLSHFEDMNTSFIMSDGENFETEERFDIIIFNETLYYFSHPDLIIKKFASYLEKGGLFLISCYTSSNRSMAIARLIRRQMKIISETRTTQGRRSWVCMVADPRASQQR